MPKLNSGSLVEIYSDPINRIGSKGIARLIMFLGIGRTVGNQHLEKWEVVFNGTTHKEVKEILC